ncbi:MAG: hypothetical protein IKI30_01045 [Oxalobacter sp.]|nr:hypothetical protein [Oxalobacter sp.]
MILKSLKRWLWIVVLCGLLPLLSWAENLRVVHLGDSHVWSKIFPRAAHARLRQRLGGGVSYQHIAKPGAYLADFLNQRSVNKVAALSPNLLVVSIGTNESYAPNFDAPKFRADMRRFMAMYRPVCRAILFTTMPGNYKKGQVNPKGRQIADIQIALAKELGYWVYDLYGAAGPVYWRRGGMMDRRGIHFNAKGYSQQGTMLGDWIVDNVMR